MKTITAINGKEYQLIKDTKEYGEVLFSKGRYYYYSKRAHRMLPLKKDRVNELEAI